MLLCLGPGISENAPRLLYMVLAGAITGVETCMLQSPKRSVALWRSWDKVRGDWLWHVHVYTRKINLGKSLHLARVLETEENVCANKWSYVRAAVFWKILQVSVVGKIVCFTSLRLVNTHFFWISWIYALWQGWGVVMGLPGPGFCGPWLHVECREHPEYLLAS